MSSDDTKTSQPQSAPRSGGLGYLVVAIIVVGGGYAYYQGWLDTVLDKYVLRETPSAPLPSVAATPAEPLTSPSVEIGGLLVELDALQSRVINLETTSRQLQAISEDFAERVNSQNLLGSSVTTDADIAKLKLELIDLRLRISGDSQAAAAELGQLANELSREHSLQTLITNNQRRLETGVSRQRILGWFGQLEGQIVQAQVAAQAALDVAAAPDPEATELLGFFSSMVKVSRDASNETTHLRHVEQLAALLPQAQNALLSSVGDRYLSSLARLQDAANALDNYQSTVVTGEITRTVSELVAAGFPANFLVLEDTGTTS